MKRCDWPLRTAETDGAAVSQILGKGGGSRAFGMWQGTEEAGQRQKRGEEGGIDEKGVDILSFML